jgi:hypothetical protein
MQQFVDSLLVNGAELYKYEIGCYRLQLWISNTAVFTGIFYVVTCRLMSRQRPKYVHSTIEELLQEEFSMCSAQCPLLGNGSLDIFPH